MSTPEGTGPRWPLRTAGLALLGLAAVAALIGLVLVITDADQTAADGPIPATTDQHPASESAPPPVIPAPPTAPTSPAPPPSVPATPAPAPAVPGPAGPGPAIPGPGPAAPVPAESDADVATSGKGDGHGAARVYNNSTIRGLATRAASDLTAAGWTVVEVGNYSGGRIPTTTVYYQEGTDQRATAEAIGAEFGLRVEPRFAGIANAPPGVIVIVTNDYGA
ncbi:MAG: LytR C-terminal domain-containing protein [Pseudonocardiaceae bacterium]